MLRKWLGFTVAALLVLAAFWCGAVLLANLSATAALALVGAWAFNKAADRAIQAALQAA